jgi:outer membrane protein assembly factor BamA
MTTSCLVLLAACFGAGPPTPAASITKVEYRGNVHLGREDLNFITGVRAGKPCNPYANRVACQLIVARYRDEGRPMTSCVLRKGREPGDTEVIFDITEGHLVRVASIGFTGNPFVSSAVLRQRIQSGAMFLKIPLSGIYNPALLDHDTTELIKYYRNFGYHDVRVSREMSYSPDGRTVAVVFHIREGVRYKVDGTPRIEGVKSVPVEALQPLVKQKGGEFYNQATIDKDRNRIRDYIGGGGVEARVDAEAVPVPGKPGLVRVKFQVIEGRRASVSHIMITGRERTDSKDTSCGGTRQLPGLTYAELKAAEQRLARRSTSGREDGSSPTLDELMEAEAHGR